MVEGMPSRFPRHEVARVEELLAIPTEQRGVDGLEEQALLLCHETPRIPGSGSISAPMTITEDCTAEE